MSLWNNYDIPPQTFRRFEIGTLQFLVYNHRKEWRIHSFKDEPNFHQLPQSGSAELLPADYPWQRFDRANDDTNYQVTLRPAFPDKALIARPASNLTIAPSGSALFYLAVPPSVEIQATAHSESPLTLTSLPITQLSKTWHGTKSTGETCYSLRSPARRSFDHPGHSPHDILVAIDLVNNLDESFTFERLYLPTQHFAIFETENKLFSNGSRLRIEKSEENLQSLTYIPKPLEPNQDAAQLTPAPKGTTRRSFLDHAFASIFS